MKLNRFSIYLDSLQYPGRHADRFLYETRCLCNFIERHLKSNKVESDGFSHLALKGFTSGLPDPALTDKTVVIPFEFDLDAYYSKADNDRLAELVELVEEEAGKASVWSSPATLAVLEAASLFKRNGYKNSWVFKKKKNRKNGSEAILECDLDLKRFQLQLTVLRDGAEVFNETILTTKPDETFFAPQLKDVKLEEETLIIFGQHSIETYRLNLDTLQSQTSWFASEHI